MMVENKKKRRNKSGAGRPAIKDENRKDYGGLSKELVAWCDGVAAERNVSRNAIIRQAVEWYRNAIEGQKPMEVVSNNNGNE